MTGIERIAYGAVRNMFDWEVGGWYNCVLDGIEESIPDTMEEAKEDIYYSAMNDYCDGRGCYIIGRAPREMRFAGEVFVRKVIDRLFEDDEDIEEISAVKGWR